MTMHHEQVQTDIKSPNISSGKFLTTFQRQLLLKNLQEDLPELYRQRIQIMLLADEGKSQTEICRTLKCCTATARHWIYIARTGMAHQWQSSPIGRPKSVNEQYLERLQELVSHSPHDYGYGFQRWTANWLSKHLAKELGVKVSEYHIKRLLKQMELSTKPNPKNPPENITQQPNASQIFIGHLKSENLLDESETLPIDFLKSETH